MHNGQNVYAYMNINFTILYFIVHEQAQSNRISNILNVHDASLNYKHDSIYTGQTSIIDKYDIHVH
jgi:hypothetical protein